MSDGARAEQSVPSEGGFESRTGKRVCRVGRAVGELSAQQPTSIAAKASRFSALISSIIALSYSFRVQFLRLSFNHLMATRVFNNQTRDRNYGLDQS